MDKDITTTDLLNLVSRSFALAIPMLDKNKKDAIELQYLLARILDTIEDSNIAPKDKEALMEAYLFVIKCQDKARLNDIKQILLANTIEENDKVLIENIEFVINSFFDLPDKIKNTSFFYLKEMSYGMIYYQENKIVNFDDLNDYCYYVAGTVGMYLTDITNIVDEQTLDKECGKSFARFLQKVNIIKDARKDFREGRVFLPLELFENSNPEPYFHNLEYEARSMEVLSTVIKDVLSEGANAVKYITDIDNKISKGYRNFCVLSLVMAFETIKIMKNNQKVFFGDNVKITKATTLSILTKIKRGYYTNEKLIEVLKNNSDL